MTEFDVSKSTKYIKQGSYKEGINIEKKNVALLFEI